MLAVVFGVASALLLQFTLLASLVPLIFTFLCAIPAFVLVTPPIVFVVRHCGVCQHRLAAFLAGACFTASYVGTFATYEVLTNPHWSVDGSSLRWLFAAVALAAVVAGCCASIATTLCRALFFTIHEQDGTVCSTCAYRIDTIQGPACPECGTPRSALTRGHGALGYFAQRMHRWFVPLAIAWIIILGSCVAVFIARSAPFWRMLRTFPQHGAVLPHIETSSSLSPISRLFDGISTSVRIDGSQTMGLLASVYRPDFWATPLMEIRLGSIESRSGELIVADGDPKVRCILDESQTRAVLGQGLPRGLVDTLVKAAEDAGWKPLGLGAFPQGGEEVTVDVNAAFNERR